MREESIRVDIPKNIIAQIIMERLDRLDAPQAVTQAITQPRISEALHGGIYAGLTIHDNAPHALVLLPGEVEGVNWKNALAWAEQQGGSLPSRIDALVLFEQLQREFRPEWYWTSAQRASDESHAWMQTFSSGDQDDYHEVYEYRARAVRRVPLSNSVI